MSYELERQVLETRFATKWIYTPIKWSNTEFKTAGVNEFITITIVHDDAKQVQIGSIKNMYRFYAFLVTQIFTKPNIGTRRAYELADNAADIWRTFSYNFITIENPELVPMGIIDGWYQLDLINPFYRNEYQFTRTYTQPFDLGFDSGFGG